MNFKKRVNGSWVDTPNYIYNTSTDAITTLPAVVYVNDTTATVGLKGNMQQIGTPTPTTPIQPQGTGERTGNLFDKTNETIGAYMLSDGTIARAQSYSLTDYIPINEGSSYTISAVTNQSSAAYHCFYTEDKVFISSINCEMIPRTFTTPANAKYIRCSYRIVSNPDIMLNTGSQSLPYEPYGIKIPISSANTTTPVYLGEVQTTRRVKKLVLDGTENWNEGTSNYYIFINVSGRGESIPNSTALSTHAESGVVVNNNGTALFFKKLVFVHSSLADFKSYLQQQYAAGTPVTVWYVLAEPTTGIVNEPLRKIGDYADAVSGISIPTIAGANTLSIGTALQPSEVSVNYKGWHPVADVHKRESGAWT